MLRKSRMVAVLSVCIMMFAAVEPAFAGWGEDMLYGACVGGKHGGFWGAIIGAFLGAGAMVITGGLAGSPLLIVAGGAGLAVTVGAVLGGASGGISAAMGGAIVGFVAGKEAVDRFIDVNPFKLAWKMATEAVNSLPVVQIIKPNTK